MMLAVSSVLMLGGMFSMTIVLRSSLMLTWACRLSSVRRPAASDVRSAATMQPVRK
jgi:hypothetical protein